LMPVAGIMVDKYNRKLMMMVSDLFAVSATVGIFFLNQAGRLELWHLFVAGAVNGIGNTFQWPAYSAAISTMIPKKHYSRANGMMSLLDSLPNVLAPLFAGFLLPVIHLSGVLLIDVATFLLAIVALLMVRITQPEKTVEGKEGEGNFIQQAVFGFKYIFQRRGLLSLLLFFLALNVLGGTAWSVFAPFILSRTGNNSASLGAVQSAFSIGAVGGGLLVSLWGGFKRRMKTILMGESLTGLGLILMGFGRSLPWWLGVGIVFAMFNPIVNGASQAIWQAKVAPDVQGRVFSSRRMIAWLLDPLTPIVGGLLADYVFEPFMQSGKGLAAAFGRVLGNTPGSGMGLQYILAGTFYFSVVVGNALFNPRLRNLEDSLPDHDTIRKIPEKG
jgi:DHA3 family macrolide efflux protein-like MFS transporter